jgi:predicted ATPase with chaperone activity
MRQRPFRDPHHSASRSAVTCAAGEARCRGHLGALFLDELLEFHGIR